ncbi:phage antirepressor [Arcanobacterium pinnipediorum]|uniref:Phage antirepressor KilAC domain-containing protein n=1 Tax=Arcanobacterium pinnipediorum TaxID=1503041 RepID=A0ABY5AIU5_9ACTO|nr:phage antirepressor KilAC domain-containing protein [Arcanobacterium pinnipediorum]USR79858.1 phage antirepressor KilAC domain-containing protein [Arcanobacterium pinnipediorum]
MGNQIQSFTNDVFGTIRTITNDGQILFCGKDVATALGYQDPTNAVKLHCRGVANYHPIEDALGRTQNARFITEGDLYRLIISSKLPAAQKFEAWVFDEVLPTIRRHGMYAYDELLADDEFLEHAIATLRAERAKRLAAEQALLEAAPKVSYYDLVLQSDSLLTTTAIAKDYGLSAKKLNRILRDAHVQFHQSGRWFLYAKYAEQGYTQSKTHEYGEGQTRTHMYWTQKGRLFIYDLLKNQLGILPVIERESQVQA